MIFVFVWLTSLCMIISRSIHVAVNGIISFFSMEDIVDIYAYMCVYSSVCVYITVCK